MSSVPSHSRTWWSFSPKQPQLPLQDPHNPYTSYKSPSSPRSNGLHSIAAALGFKSKKHATLAVQHPSTRPSLPAIITKQRAPSDPSFPPPSRSTPSGIDSVGPQTPIDSHQPPFDNDPFAARSPSSPYGSDIKPFPSLPNSSSPDIRSKSRDLTLSRVQRALSHSNNPQGGSSPSREFQQYALESKSTRKPKESTGSLHRKRSLAAVDRSIGSVVEIFNSQPSIYKSRSSTTLTDKNRLSQPEPAPMPRPPMRARGMTDSGTDQRFTSSEAVIPSPQISPSLRVIIRQPSVSRIGLPPSAPPSHELPLPPPMIKGRPGDIEVEVPPLPHTSSASSSSSLSFASSAPAERDTRNNSPRKKASQVPDDVETHGASRKSSPSHTPRTLKKAISHQSLGRKGHASNGSASPPLDLPGSHKPLQKQRSFHQSKAASIFPPIPTLVKSNRASGSTLSNEASPVEQRRGSSSSGISLPARKRLFSGSSLRRPSTSQCIISDDDGRSMFSVQSESEHFSGKSFEPLQRQMSPTTTVSSCWDESLSDVPQSPSYVAIDYTPQKIMSSAEIAELAASLEPAVSGRERGFSILSTSTTVTSDGEDERMSKARRSSGSATSSVYGETSTSSVTSAGSPVRKVFSSDRAPFRLSIFRSANETTEQSTPDPDTQKPKTLKPSPPTNPPTSLPPPPRRLRTRPLLISEEPLPVLPSVAALGRKFVRPKVSVEKILHRRSLMKKPSFLDIDDDTDGKDTDVEGAAEPQTGSFLDLARDSIDTMTSINEY